MIVDDNDAVRAKMRAILETTAPVICECIDGNQALDSYRRFHPDWVLMDIRMKVMDGFQATEEILSIFPDAKIVMVTQYDEPSLREKAKQVGAYDFVLKENLFDIERIINAQNN
jgi:CheY-like chemotaxis protein